MAFSIRIGTKWCHDFPKLARESGFYFNMHRSRAGIDWNRINNIDINRVIREKDFQSIDDNINNVIDYHLESEYDVKILDPNFVKLFRLAQLAVEYLLYCKQYLDHSVIILKDELRSKIEENVKLKNEVASLEEVIAYMKEKAKERSRLMETKIRDCSGEIFKCPHCPKTFISPMFLNAHIVRRHTYISNSYVPPSPIHEQYRSETERLHNEIKSLKERLNETERVIRNESEKVADKKILDYDKKQAEKESESLKPVNAKSEEHSEYKEYQEEIRNLKTMLFDEIHTLRQKEKTMYERTSETNVQTLINQQEKEFQKLKTQLLEKLTPDIEGMHSKLFVQENYWMSKIEQLENQHCKDIERLNTELKLTQKAANDMKAVYEAKVHDLERQTADQSNILIEQSKQLNSLSQEINIAQLHEKNRVFESNLSKIFDQSIISDKSNDTLQNKMDGSGSPQNYSIDTKVERITVVDSAINSTMKSNLSSKVFPSTEEDKRLKIVHASGTKNKPIVREDKRNNKQESIKNVKIAKHDCVKSIKKDLENCSPSDTFASEDFIPEKKTIKAELNKSSIDKLENAFNKNTSDIKDSNKCDVLENNLSSTASSESSVSDINTESITTIDNNSPLEECKTSSPPSLTLKKATDHGSFYKKVQTSLKETFEQKLKDLGIDPEWQGIPKATFKQKMDILKHHHKLAAKRFTKYHQIKLKIIEEMLNKISRKKKAAESWKQLNKSPSRKKPKDSDNHASMLQDVILNKFHSTPDSNQSTKNIIKHKSTPIKSESYKSTEKLQVSLSSIKSPEVVQHRNSQEYSMKQDSLNKTKSLFNCDIFKVTPNNTSISSSKSVQNMEQELQDIFISPKHNKSVLKSASGSASNLTKKKVIFDLTNEKDKESSSDDDSEKAELNESNWNTSSASEERKYASEVENSKSSNNIVLKTAQSDKIAELSRKLEAQLNMVRQKPAGSVETIFTSKYIQNKENQDKNSRQINSISLSSLLDSPFYAPVSNLKKLSDSLPQPAPRNFKDKVSETLYTESISEISDLDSDIDKILKLE